MPLDTRNKNIHGLGVGILTIFKLFGHFLFEGGQDQHPGPITYILFDAPYTGTTIYMV
jgi:hypothetical protein